MGKRILIVEDDAGVRDYLTAALEGLGPGIEVVSSANGREAGEVIDARPVDLVLTDLNMPEVNGLELVRRLRRERPGLAIILMSGTSSEWIAALMAEGLGELPLLEKPITVTQVLEVVGPLLAL